MRHLRSIIYALVLGPSVWVLSGVGFTHDLSSRGRELFAAESISGLLLLIFAGILFAILAFAPVSPAGPVLAGVVFLGVTIWAWNSPEAYASLWAPEVSKEGFDLSRPGYGLAALLAIPLLGTALSARRWARYEPPVLPIIGEIGRFRGAAKVAGTSVAAEQTTVIRTGVPAVASPMPADRTVAFNTNTSTDRTVIVADAEADADRTVFVSQTPAEPSTAQPSTPPAQRPTAAPTQPAEPTQPVSPAQPAEPTQPVSPAQPTAAPAPPAATSEATVAIRTIEAEQATAPISEPVTAPENAERTAAPTEPAQPADTPAEAGKDEATFQLPRQDDDRTRMLSFPPAGPDPDATTLIPAQRRPPAIES